MNHSRKPKIALISDELTRTCLHHDSEFNDITPLNYRFYFKFGKPDFLLVESSWSGYKNKWKYKIAAYDIEFKRNNNSLLKLLDFAKNKGIPTVFWNKEDGVHFDRFIDSARHFDHIFTVDENCISRYREIVPASTSVNVLMFPVQPRYHFFQGFNFKDNCANFIGSYSHHIHDERRRRQDFLLKAASDTLGLRVYDRNSKRSSANYRYPNLKNMEIYSAVSNDKTAEIYRKHLVSLNVNTVDDSPTMYSRRLIEIIACGGIAVTTPAQSVDMFFNDYCHVVDDYDHAYELLSRLKSGPSSVDLERARAGAEYVATHHTWKHRLDQISDVLGFECIV